MNGTLIGFFVGTVWAFSKTCLISHLNTFGMNQSKDYEPTSVSELINAQRMVKIFRKTLQSLVESLLTRAEADICYQTNMLISPT